jgi:hypothetical protein
MTNALHSNNAQAADEPQKAVRSRRSLKAKFVAAVLAAFAVLLLLVVAGGTLFVFKSREIGGYNRLFDEVRIGDDSARAVALLGKPHQVHEYPKLLRAAPTTFPFAGDQTTTQRQLVYFVETPFLPLVYVFDLDQDDVIVAKYRFD